MTRLQASSLAAQNIGGIITVNFEGSVISAAIEAIEQTSCTTKVYTTLTDVPFEFAHDEIVELSLQHGALYVRQLRQDMDRLFEWLRSTVDEIYPHEEEVLS